jgi:serine protease Do
MFSEKLLLKPLIFLGFFVLLYPINTGHSLLNLNQLVNDISEEKKTEEIEQIAQEITVRILTKYGGGSGVIISQYHHIYTILTNDHVLGKNKENEYKILTADGQIHQGKLVENIDFKGLDLAVLEFESKDSYQVVKIGNSQEVKTGDRVLSSGFPNYYYYLDENKIESTYNWGIKAFKLTRGTIEMLPKKSLERGYNLGYTNNVDLGMSGGAVLNEKGELIGINGRLKHPIQGIKVYIFTDGTTPSVEMFKQMETLSWAISVNTFVPLISKN